MSKKGLNEYKPLQAVDQSYKPLPRPSQSCKLSVMRTGTLRMPGFLFVQGYKGDMHLEDYSFLIEHPKERILFDLGLRKGLKYNEKTHNLFNTWPGSAPTGPQEILEESGIPVSSINTVIFSHTHFDHVGDLSCFPDSTNLLLGPFEDSSKVDDLAKLSDSLQVKQETIQARKISHLTKVNWKQHGSFRGVDYFEDGSLILLDTPGHMEGHIAALVCVAVEPEPIYYVLAGDAAHHISLIDYDSPTHIGVYKSKENELSSKKDSDPEALQCFEDDLGKSYDTMARLARMDHEKNIAVLLAHDSSLAGVLNQISQDKLVRLSGTSQELALFKSRSRQD